MATRCSPGTPVKERIRHHTAEDSNGCWRWQSGLDSHGYGSISIDGRTHKAHRASYEAFVEEIPEGLDIDHLCRVRDCVNPDHLEPVTRSVNLLRGDLSDNNGRNAWTECPRGHAYTPANTYVCPKGTRNCRACRRIATRRFHGRHTTQPAS